MIVFRRPQPRIYHFHACSCPVYVRRLRIILLDFEFVPQKNAVAPPQKFSGFEEFAFADLQKSTQYLVFWWDHVYVGQLAPSEREVGFIDVGILGVGALRCSGAVSENLQKISSRFIVIGLYFVHYRQTFCLLVQYFPKL